LLLKFSFLAEADLGEGPDGNPVPSLFSFSIKKKEKKEKKTEGRKA